MTFTWISGPARRSAASAGRAHGRAGFTLLEAVIALAILGIAVVSMIASLSAGLRAGSGAETRMTEVVLADMRMSELAALPVESLRRYAEPQVGRFGPPFSAYEWRALVRPAAAATGLMNAAVVVHGPGGEYVLETAFYRPDAESALTAGRAE